MDATRPIAALRAGWLTGDGSPRAALEYWLERIAAREHEVNAFATLDIESARRQADASGDRYKAGRPLSGIDGLAIGLKDNLETVDLPTDFGSPIYDGNRTGRDSAIAFGVRQAGAVIVGKTVTTEFASAHQFGRTRNPHDLTRTPGGSSSGSAAAVGAGMLPIAVGTQVIGSVLRPAGFNGVIGFKPTYGALNKGGSSDSYSQNTVGMLARHIGDVYAVCHAIASRVGGDPGFPPFRGGPTPAPAQKPLRLGFLETAGWAVAEDATKAAFQDAVAKIAGTGVTLLDRRGSRRIEVLEQRILNARDISTAICTYEGIWPFSELATRALDRYSPNMRGRVAESAAMTPDDYGALLMQREVMRDALLALSGEVDAFVTLCHPGPAPKGFETTGNPIFNVPFSALRVPAFSLPLLQVDGMPVGVQIVGFPNGDRPLSGHARYLLDLWGLDTTVD